jgi:hypothetical protein
VGGHGFEESGCEGIGLLVVGDGRATFVLVLAEVMVPFVRTFTKPSDSRAFVNSRAETPLGRFKR